jgi:hypothetical protein
VTSTSTNRHKKGRSSAQSASREVEEPSLETSVHEQRVDHGVGQAPLWAKTGEPVGNGQLCGANFRGDLTNTTLGGPDGIHSARRRVSTQKTPQGGTRELGVRLQVFQRNLLLYPMG